MCWVAPTAACGACKCATEALSFGVDLAHMKGVGCTSVQGALPSERLGEPMVGLASYHVRKAPASHRGTLVSCITRSDKQAARLKNFCTVSLDMGHNFKALLHIRRSDMSNSRRRLPTFLSHGMSGPPPETLAEVRGRPTLMPDRLPPATIAIPNMYGSAKNSHARAVRCLGVICSCSHSPGMCSTVWLQVAELRVSHLIARPHPAMLPRAARRASRRGPSVPQP